MVSQKLVKLMKVSHHPIHLYLYVEIHFLLTSASYLGILILYNIFSKAEKLVCSATSICQSPGSTDARLVESKSGQRPHFVVKTRNSKYNCDADCPMWKCSMLCSHTVACAYLDDVYKNF